MTHQELFDSTIQAYLIDGEPFGYDAVRASCRYLAPDGSKCAIGRHLTSEDFAYIDRGDLLLRAGTLQRKYPNIMAARFGDLDGFLLNQIQSCHDKAAREDYDDERRQVLRYELDKMAKAYRLDTTLLDTVKP